MADLGNVGINTEITPNSGVKVIQVVTDATVDDEDSITVDLSKFGCTNIHGILGFQEDTTGQVISASDPTTSVASSILKIEIGGSDDDLKRVFIIWAY